MPDAAAIESGVSQDIRRADVSTEATRPPVFLGEHPGRFHATASAAGPWSPNQCHGGAPAALITRIAEEVPTLARMEVARLSVELFRPVPTVPRQHQCFGPLKPDGRNLCNTYGQAIFCLAVKRRGCANDFHGYVLLFN